MMRMLLSIIGVLLILIVVCSICSEQTRSFYCLSEGKCVTVWKRYGDKCYIVLDKYNGIFKPTDNYIKTSNMAAIVDVIWTEDNVEIVQPHSDKNYVIERYSKAKVINDSRYTYFDGKYSRYNEQVNYIRLYVKENYATDRANKKIK